MRPLVLEEAPIVAAAHAVPSAAEAAAFSVRLEEIPEPALNTLVTVA